MHTPLWLSDAGADRERFDQEILESASTMSEGTGTAALCAAACTSGAFGVACKQLQLLHGA